jgi:hypothetical protein
MKRHALLLIAAASLLSGCIVYDDPYRDGGGRHGDHDRYGGSEHDRDRYRNRDRDHDGVPNRQDRRPDDPARY